MDYLAAQAIVSSITYSAATFTDGSASTATFTVSSFAALSSATATGILTVNNNTTLGGTCISAGGYGLGSYTACNPAQWAVGASSAATACNIASAISAYGIIRASCTIGASSGIVFTTAPVYGSVWNTFQSSGPAGITVGTFSGGQDNQTIKINGVTLTANSQWFPVTSNAVTATNLATAINNSSTTTGVVASAGANAVVFATATAVGTSTNYAIATSSYSALQIATLTSSSPITGAGLGAMTNGTNSQFTINQASISAGVNGNLDVTGLAVLYSTGSGVAITPLVTGTTYYIVDVAAANAFQLATTSTGALAGLGITLTSSQTKTTADTFTLTPLAITGTPNFQWMVSDDQTTWVPWTTTTYGQTIPSVSLGTYNSTGTVVTWDLGHVSHGYVGLQVQPPTTGALNFKVKTVGRGN